MTQGVFSKVRACAMVCVLAALAAPLASAQMHGRVYDELSMTSKILDMERKYAVYLPPDYDSSARSYPVLYLLHGGGDDQTGWVQFGEVLHIADKAIREGKATPMVIVMPDANTGRRGYGNDMTGAWRYEDFFFEELMPYVEKEYRIKSEKRYRAVAGLSMGGHGTFLYAMHRPELFSSACPLSASTGPNSAEEIQRRLERYVGDADADSISEEDIQAYVARNGAVLMAQNLDVEGLKSVRWYLDCGDDDFLYEGNALVHIAFRQREVPHEYRVRDGGHTWTYWRESLPDVLHFVSQAFHQH